MALILKQESTGSVPTPDSGKTALFVDTTGQIGVKQPGGTTVVTGNITSVNLDGNVSNVLSGTGTWIAAGGGGGSPSGSNTYVQYNNAGSFGSNSNFTFDSAYAGGALSAPHIRATGAAGLEVTNNANIYGNVSVTSNVNAGNINVGSYLSIQNNGNISGAGGVSVFFLTSSGGVSTSSLTVSATANLGAVGNVVISGGSSGYVLSTDGAGTLSWVAQSGGSANLEAVNTDILPTFDSVYDLGSTAKRFDNLFLGTSANINGAVLTGSTVGNTVTLATSDAFSANSLLATSSLIGNVYTIANTISAIDYYGNVSTLSVTGNLALGAVGNLQIPGGSSGQVLSTDGAGNLSWGSPALVVYPVTSTTYVTAADNGKFFVMNPYETLYMPVAGTVDQGFSFKVYTANTGGNLYIYSTQTVYESGTSGSNVYTNMMWPMSAQSIVTITNATGNVWVANYK